MAGSEMTIANRIPNPGNLATLAPVEGGQERQKVSEGGKVSPQEAAPEVNRETIKEAVSEISDYVQNISRELQFQVDEEIGSTIVTVVDRDSGDIIRQIPSEEIVQLARHIAENGPDPVKGLLINSDGVN